MFPDQSSLILVREVFLAIEIDRFLLFRWVFFYQRLWIEIDRFFFLLVRWVFFYQRLWILAIEIDRLLVLIGGREGGERAIRSLLEFQNWNVEAALEESPTLTAGCAFSVAPVDLHDSLRRLRTSYRIPRRAPDRLPRAGRRPHRNGGREPSRFFYTHSTHRCSSGTNDWGDGDSCRLSRKIDRRSDQVRPLPRMPTKMTAIAACMNGRSLPPPIGVCLSHRTVRAAVDSPVPGSTVGRWSNSGRTRSSAPDSMSYRTGDRRLNEKLNPNL